MSRRVFYLTHPQVQIDPAVPVPRWGLSVLGRARAEAAAMAGWTQRLGLIVSSDETKAVETAAIIGMSRGIAPFAVAEMHENDRSATGFLPPPEFEIVADAFFANPHDSVRGWERAIDAQQRIARASETILRGALPKGDVLFVGHGAVGTLLLCHHLNEPISRLRDQPAGGGHVFAFEGETRAVLHGWRPLEAMDNGAG